MGKMTTKEHLSVHDRQIAAMRELLRGGIQTVSLTDTPKRGVEYSHKIGLQYPNIP